MFYSFDFQYFILQTTKESSIYANYLVLNQGVEKNVCGESNHFSCF